MWIEGVKERCGGGDMWEGQRTSFTGPANSADITNKSNMHISPPPFHPL